jgi:8-oxo-dGTP pyrophosphatase MutT (NUDIX family)
VIIPFYGDLTVFVRKEPSTGWQFPTSTRRSGETILEVAKRELWDSARIVASKLDLLGAVRSTDPKPSTSYVYMCEVRHLPWAYEIPEDVAEIGVFARTPRPLASEWSEVVLEAAYRARRTGLR